MTKHVSEVQIVKILEEFRSGIKPEELCRTYGIPVARCISGVRNMGSYGLFEVKRIKQLEQENRKLKAMYAELSLRNEALKDVIAKKF